jgi:FdhD protein
MGMSVREVCGMTTMTARRRVVRFVGGAGGTATPRPDTLVTEEPLEMRVNGTPLAVTMRTPGHDFELVTGFLVAEGVIAHPSEIRAIRHCADLTAAPGEIPVAGLIAENIVDVTLAPGVDVPEETMTRHTVTTSACGLCGKTSLDAVRATTRFDVAADPVALDPNVVLALPGRLRSAQRVFDRTGGLHAAGLFTAAGERIRVREDVGRHNAVDKLLGWAVQHDLLPLTGRVLVVSGRASFELVQKAVMAGIPAMAAVSAPSTLAAELAAESGLTLAGFVRGDSMNVYTGAHRLGMTVA